MLTTTKPLRQQHAEDRPVNFYRTHGRAFFKALTLAFLTYQITYWAWLKLETEEDMAAKTAELKEAEENVRRSQAAR